MLFKTIFKEKGHANLIGMWQQTTCPGNPQSGSSSRFEWTYVKTYTDRQSEGKEIEDERTAGKHSDSSIEVFLHGLIITTSYMR